MNSDHAYTVGVEWRGNRGTGTSAYRAYGRQSLVRSEGKHDIVASADKTFHGDADRWNPEELLVAALSECHMLAYLHVAVNHDVVVTAYSDTAAGVMHLENDGSGQFTSVTLHPVVTVADASQVALAQTLHAEASRLCFIARSVAFPVRHEPTTIVAGGS